MDWVHRLSCSDLKSELWEEGYPGPGSPSRRQGKSWNQPYGFRTLGVYGILLEVWGWGSPIGELREKVPRGGSRARIQGVSGGKAQAHISPGEGFGYFLEESIAILASSGVQVPSFFDFQQIGQ